MKGLDLADVVALAAEVSEVEPSKLLELLDTAQLVALLATAQPPAPPHASAAALMVGIAGLAPLPAGNRRLALLAGLHLLAVNGLDAALDPVEGRTLLAGAADASSVAAWLDGRVTACDPLDGVLRRALSPDGWRALELAVHRARRHRRRLASPEDLLLAVFREGTGPGAVALGATGPTMEPVGPHGLPPAVPAFEPGTRKALELALRAATARGDRELHTGHLLLGLLDAGHGAVLPAGLDQSDVRRQLLESLAERRRPEADDDLAGRLHRLADRLRDTDPTAAAELDEVADLQRLGLDRIVEMINAWRGEIFLEAMARDDTVVRLLGLQRLGARGDDALKARLLTKYVADIARYPRLTRAEETELGSRMRADVAEEAAGARRRLVQAHLELVVTIARKYEVSGMSLLDLVQEGNLGLLRAAEAYDPSKGYRFSTFATWWIRHAILTAIARRR